LRAILSIQKSCGLAGFGKEEKGALKFIFKAPLWGFGRGISADALYNAIVSPKLKSFRFSALIFKK